VRFYNVTHKHYCGIDLHRGTCTPASSTKKGKLCFIVTCRRFPKFS
jgi:hypothetical protein